MDHSTTVARPAKELSVVASSAEDVPSAMLNWQVSPIPTTKAWIPNDLYQEIVTWMPLVCVDTLVVRDGCALLTRRRQEPQAGSLWVQGGRLQKSESLEGAALRTAEVESGLRLSLTMVLGTFSTVFDCSAHGGVPTHTVNVTFLGHPVDHSEPVVDANHDTFVWWPLVKLTGNPYLDHLFSLAEKAVRERSSS